MDTIAEENILTLDNFLEQLRTSVREDMNNRNMSLNQYAADFLEMPPSTLSKFLSGDRAGHGFETLFYIRDKTIHNYKRHYSKIRLNRLHKNLSDAVTQLHQKHTSYESVGRALGLSKTAVMHLTNPKAKLPQTTTILKVLSYIDADIDELASE